MTTVQQTQTAADSRPVLGRLSAVDAATFRTDYWGTQALYSPAADLPRDFHDLFSVAAADELLSTRGLRTPFLRVAKNGEIVPPARFTGPGGVGGLIADQVLDERVLELFADGHTLVLQGLHRLWAPLIAFTGTLTAELGHPVQVNAYITPEGSQGFSAHHDVHDVFVLQVAGRKRWIVHEPVFESPLPDQAWTAHRAAVAQRTAEPPVIDTVLEEGDCLYLPRGFVHSAEAIGGLSAHLTVGVHVHTRFEIVEALVELLAGDAGLRQSLPLGVDVGDATAIEDDLRETVERAVECLRRATPGEVAAVLARRDRSATRPAPLRPLAQATAAAHLDAATWIAVRPGLAVSIAEQADGLAVSANGRSVSLPAAAGRAVRQLVEAAAAIEVADLVPGDDDAAVAAAQGLLRLGLVVPAEGDPEAAVGR